MQYILYILITTTMIYSQDCNQNNWQQYNPNLEYCDLAGVNIAWADMSGFNFFGANLTNSNLTGSDFSGANLTNAILVDADLTWTTFIGANLTNANLSGAGLGAADFTNANLFGANLYGTTIFDTNFSNACIENAYGFPTSGYIGETIDEGCAPSETDPDWSVDPAAFEYNMALTARIYDQLNVDIGSENDLLGAFNEQDECVGLAEAAEVPVFLGGGYAFLVQIYSHYEGGEYINFYFYDETANHVYDASPNIEFISDGIVGDVFNAFILYIIEQSNNTAPTAESATYTLDEDNMITVYLSATDADGDALTFTILDYPTSGMATLSGSAATYYPNANYHGADNFSFIVNDGQENSNSATINFIINAVNDAPYLYAIPDAEINAGELFVYALEAIDVDGDDLLYAATTTNGEGVVALSNNILTAEGAPNSILDISITVSDGMATDQTSFTLTILGEPCLEEYEQGFLDGAATGDVNGDGELNIVDIVFFIEMILNGE